MNLRLYIITFCLLFAGLALHGQAPEKRFVGNCRFSGFALLADSSYRGDIINFTDRMGDGYNLTQLAVGYEIFDGRGLVFEIDTIHESTNFTADVSVTAKVNRGFAPFGSGQVYNPTENGLIPPSSQEQAGLSPTQKARIDIHNVVTMQSLFALADSLRADGDKSAPILVPVFDRNTQLDGCSTAETIYTGFLLIDNEAIDEGAITFEINASPATVTYDVYNADSTSYYFETSASRGAGVYFWEVSYTDADGNNVGDTNAFDVVAGTPDSVLTVVQDSILVLRVCGVEISRDTLPEGNPGTVTSVALSLPGEFAVSGSPVTSSGTLSGTWNTQAANTVLAGPDSGGAAAPTFRSLVASDITAGGGVTGSGTTNYLSKWTGSSDLGNSLIYDNGTNIGIGTISPGYKLDLVGSLNIPRSGVLYSSGVRALHFSENIDTINYGRNVFLGINAGNLTTTSILNVAVGGSALSTVTTGSRNSALGYQALSSLTDGIGNTVIGAESMKNGLSDSYNTAIGTQVLQSGGNWNIGIGFQALSGGSGMDNNTVIGNQNMLVAANSDNNTIIGHNAARLNSVLADLTSINNATIVGYAAKPVNGSTNETIIGYDITGNGSNTVTIGNNNVTTHYLNGTGGVKISTGTTAQRPINALGVLRGNSTDSDIEWGDGVSWWKIPKSSVSTYTQGSVLFAGTSGQAQQDNANFFWDDTNNRLGIGTNNTSSSVDTKLKIIGSGSAAAGRTALLIQNTNSGGAAQIQLLNNSDNGVVMQANGTGYPSGQSAVVSSIGDIDFRFTTNGGASSGGVAGVIFRLGGYGNTSQVYFLPSGTGPNPSALMGINTPTPARTLHVVGEARITDLTTDTPTRIVGADADGDLGEMTAGTGISFAGGQVSIILDKQSATYYEETERQYTLGTSPSADTVITIDTIGVAFAADSISIAAGLITNDRSTTVTWLVHYDFTYTSDEDPCYSFFDLTTDGSEVPAAIAGSSAYSNQVSILGTQHPGRSFLVNVPAGQAIRLCVKGNILAATEMNISYLTITIQEK